VFLDGGEAPVFTLLFSPGDPFVMRYADNLQNTGAPEVDAETGEFLSYADKLEKNIDAIFGEGAARHIFRYDDAAHTILTAVLAKVREGRDDYLEKAAEAESAAKRQAIVDAKKEAAPYIAPVK